MLFGHICNLRFAVHKSNCRCQSQRCEACRFVGRVAHAPELGGFASILTKVAQAPACIRRPSGDRLCCLSRIAHKSHRSAQRRFLQKLSEISKGIGRGGVATVEEFIHVKALAAHPPIFLQKDPVFAKLPGDLLHFMIGAPRKTCSHENAA